MVHNIFNRLMDNQSKSLAMNYGTKGLNLFINLRCPIFRYLIGTTVFLVAMFCGTSLFAHSVGENYIFLNVHKDSIDGRFEIHFQDLKDKLGIHVKGESSEQLEVINATVTQVRNYIRKNFKISGGGEDFNLVFTKQLVLEIPKGNFAQYFFTLETGPVPDVLEFRHSMFYENDSFHRGLLLVEYNQRTNTHNKTEQTALIFSKQTGVQQLDLNAVPTLLRPRDMIWQGVLHIWIGIDHILFILAIIVTTLMIWEGDKWVPVPNFKKAFFNVLSIFTVFTIAHSITLGLAALEFVKVPSRLVESIIALSIVLVAVNNIFSKVKHHGSLLIILGLGLFHGLGFASVMGHLPFRMQHLLRYVLGFNIGVEFGQIAIVTTTFPILYLLRENRAYVPVVIKGVSIVLSIVATVWFVQRVFGLS